MGENIWERYIYLQKGYNLIKHVYEIKTSMERENKQRKNIYSKENKYREKICME